MISTSQGETSTPSGLARLNSAATFTLLSGQDKELENILPRTVIDIELTESVTK
jgi:hypothetical protein